MRIELWKREVLQERVRCSLVRCQSLSDDLILVQPEFLLLVRVLREVVLEQLLEELCVLFLLVSLLNELLLVLPLLEGRQLVLPVTFCVNLNKISSSTFTTKAPRE